MSYRLPSGESETPLLRTDASQPDRWAALLAAIRTPNADGFVAYVSVATDAALDGLDEPAIRRLPRDANSAGFVLVADAEAQAGDEFPILVVDLSGEDRPSFRVAARCLWSVQNNLSIANLDWANFTDYLGADGVYREC
jgi:hypothetical protein